MTRAQRVLWFVQSLLPLVLEAYRRWESERVKSDPSRRK